MNDSDLNQIASLLDQKLEEKLTQKLEPIHKELKKHSKMLRSLKKDQDTILKVLDREQMGQSKRLKRVEDHLGITSTLP
jgi:hypothetical protein